ICENAYDAELGAFAWPRAPRCLSLLRPLLLMHEPDRGGACLLAPAALCRAHLAMLMVACVLLAFLGANPARQRAGLDHCPQDLLVGSCAARGERSGCAANVGAIEVEPYALAEPRHVVFGDAGIGTSGARLRAGEARLDACDQRLADAAFQVRMSRN